MIFLISGYQYEYMHVVAVYNYLSDYSSFCPEIIECKKFVFTDYCKLTLFEIIKRLNYSRLLMH